MTSPAGAGNLPRASGSESHRDSIFTVKILARLLILFIAFAALPLRGLAATGFGPCAGGHAQSHAASHAGAHGHLTGHDAHRAAHGHAGPHTHQHELASAHAAGHTAGTQDAGSVPDGDSMPAGGCSLCAAHCAGMSLETAAPITSAWSPFSTERIRTPQHLLAGFIPALPDRPPLVASGR